MKYGLYVNNYKHGNYAKLEGYMQQISRIQNLYNNNTNRSLTCNRTALDMSAGTSDLGSCNHYLIWQEMYNMQDNSNADTMACIIIIVAC
jgi:hypothetical protein